MSTKERYGTLVWDAIVQISQTSTPFMSVGEVADKAQVSRQTAKKYLEQLIKTGHLTMWNGNAIHKFYVMTGMSHE